MKGAEGVIKDKQKKELFDILSSFDGIKSKQKSKCCFLFYCIIELMFEQSLLLWPK